MGGTVSVKSAPGEGAAFSVTLPARPETVDDHPHAFAPPVDVEPPPATGTSSVGTATLLYIEDNAPNVRVVEHLLRLRPEWRMIHAALGGLGVEFARAHHPDLVLLDLHLPDLSGREVLRALKRRDDTKDIPVVILSADASPGLARKLEAAGADSLPHQAARLRRRAGAARPGAPRATRGHRPRRGRYPVTAPEGAASAGAPGAWGADILVVEDFAPLSVLLVRVLTAEGHRVTAVATGLAAEAACSAEQFDLLVTDVPDPRGQRRRHRQAGGARTPGLARALRVRVGRA